LVRTTIAIRSPAASNRSIDISEARPYRTPARTWRRGKEENDHGRIRDFIQTRVSTIRPSLGFSDYRNQSADSSKLHE
jgi:hypothetical protein